MPTRADIAAATPRCQATRKMPGAARINFGLAGGNTHQIIKVICYSPLRYEHHENQWICPQCGERVLGELVASNRLAVAA